MKFAKQQSNHGARVARSALSGAALMLLAAGFGATAFALDAPRAKSEPVTFSNQIVRLFQENCQTCHREGGNAPFSLTNYESAYPFRNQIADATKMRRMPPWKPVAGFGEFQH